MRLLAHLSNGLKETGCTYAWPKVIVLKTLKIMTPIGFPGIIKPARNGEITLSAE